MFGKTTGSKNVSPWCTRATLAVYGARKVWLEFNRQGMAVARCTVERLMRELGLHGAGRGPAVRAPPCPGQTRVHRTCSGGTSPPRRLTAAGRRLHLRGDRACMVYVAFVVDVYSRAIVGWAVPPTSAPSSCWTPCRWRCGGETGTGAGRTRPGAPLRRRIQYTSFAFTAHLIEAGTTPRSVPSGMPWTTP